jgi:CubicO group peptidase (beta-lactamase class C family)
MKAVLSLASTAILATLAGASAAQPTDPAVGLWSYRTSYVVGPRGELLLKRTGARWHGSIGGLEADAEAPGTDIRLDFPGGVGTFRGSFDQGVLHGFWARRAVFEDPAFAAGEALSYAGPLQLRPAGHDRWRATVVPLEDTFTLYLEIFRDKDGTLKAAFRNPEMNSHGEAMQYALTETADALHFSAKPTANSAELHLDATLLHRPDRISILWKDLNKTIELSRTTLQAATRFSPRPPGSAPYVYRTPAEDGDGWNIARAHDVGMDETILAKAVEHIIDIDPADRRAWLIHSISVARHGKLVLDEYFYGTNPDLPHDTRSASKTFSSVILGAMMLEGSPLTPQTKIATVMAPLAPFANPDPRKAEIALGHLLTHTAGFACDDNADVSPGNEDAIEADRAHSDWTRVTLDLPMAYDPGTHYAYCSMNINLAGAVLSRASGEWLPALFDRTVARPLRFGPYYWNLQGNGAGYLGGGVFVRPRDFLKIGQAYLDGGVWNGRRIASTAWTKAATAEQTHISPATTGRTGDAFREVYYDTGEGYAWHLYTVKSGDESYPAYLANGNGGQLLIVVPQFDLVAMFSAGNYGQGVWNRERDDVLGGMILPAIVDAHR